MAYNEPPLPDLEYSPQVVTKYGRIAGVYQDGIRKFFGVPYARPPLRKQRFCPPQEPESWHKVLRCQRCKPMCPQSLLPPLPGSTPSSSALAVDGRRISASEDCLYLNIFAPEQADNAPVYVWIHGGAWIIGSGSETLYDGTRLAKQGIVVVNVTYRLGALGFISHPDIAQGTNLGMLDQVQALKWVQENIAAFGGNPQAVTVGGQSAGAFCISALTLSPVTSGLFHQIILESGNILGPSFVHGQGGTSIKAVQTRTQEIMRRAGCTDIDDLRRCPTDTLLRAATFDQDFIATVDTPNNVGIVGDGHLLPLNFQKALKNGEFHKVKILAGFTRDEGTMFLRETSLPKYQNFIHRFFEGRESEINARFPVSPSNVQSRAAEMIKYLYFVVGTKMMADRFAKTGQDVYYYHFNYFLPNGKVNSLGICHSAELYYVFNSHFEKGKNPFYEPLVERVSTYWANFIKHGDPNSEGLPRWEKYSPSQAHCMNFDESPAMIPLPHREDLDYLAERLVEP